MNVSVSQSVSASVSWHTRDRVSCHDVILPLKRSKCCLVYCCVLCRFVHDSWYDKIHVAYFILHRIAYCMVFDLDLDLNLSNQHSCKWKHINPDIKIWNDIK